MEYFLALLKQDGDSYIELNAESYNRKAVFFDFTTGYNVNAIEFDPVAEWDGWGTATHIGIFDRRRLGNRISVGTTPSPIECVYGTMLKIGVGGVTLVTPIPDYESCCDAILSKLDNVCQDSVVYEAPSLSNITANASNSQVFGDTLESITLQTNITVGTNETLSAVLKVNGSHVSDLEIVNNTINYTYNVEMTNETAFTIEVNDGKTTVSKSFTVEFLYRIYWGRGIDTIDNYVLSSNKLNTNEHSTFVFPINPIDSDTAYLWINIPSVLPILNVNTDFINPANYTIAPFAAPVLIDDYRCYRSANQLNGAISIKS